MQNSSTIKFSDSPCTDDDESDGMMFVRGSPLKHESENESEKELQNQEEEKTIPK